MQFWPATVTKRADMAGRSTLEILEANKDFSIAPAMAKKVVLCQANESFCKKANVSKGEFTANAGAVLNFGAAGTVECASSMTQSEIGKVSALTFSGNYVSVPHAASLNLTTGMTLEAWVYPTTNGGYGTAVMKEQSGQYVYSLYGSAPGNPRLFSAPRPRSSVTICGPR